MSIRSTTNPADLAPPLSIEAMRPLAGAPREAAEQLFALLATLASPDEESVAWANDCLQPIENPPADAERDLAALCSSNCVPMAAWACKLLGRLGEQSDTVEEPLVDALRQHPSVAVKQAAALALGKLRELSSSAQEALLAASHTDDARLKRLATQTLGAKDR